MTLSASTRWMMLEDYGFACKCKKCVAEDLDQEDEAYANFDGDDDDDDDAESEDDESAVDSNARELEEEARGFR